MLSQFGVDGANGILMTSSGKREQILWKLGDGADGSGGDGQKGKFAVAIRQD